MGKVFVMQSRSHELFEPSPNQSMRRGGQRARGAVGLLLLAFGCSSNESQEDAAQVPFETGGGGQQTGAQADLGMMASAGGTTDASPSPSIAAMAPASSNPEMLDGSGLGVSAEGGAGSQSDSAASSGGAASSRGAASSEGGAAAGGTAGDGMSGEPADTIAPNGDPCLAVDVGAGDMHSCALTGDGTVYCWGRNNEGQVGPGAANKQTTPLEITAAGKDNVDLMVGHHVSCVKKVSGRVDCWGTFDDGMDWKNVQEPREFDVFAEDWVEMDIDTSACVRRASDNKIACWGYENDFATTIEGFGDELLQIDLEFRTLCGVSSGGEVLCRTDTSPPRTVDGISDAVNVGLRRDHNGLGEPEDIMAAGADGRGYIARNGGRFQEMNLDGERVVLYNAQHHLIGALSDTGRVMLWHSAICGGFGDNYPPDDNGSQAGDRRNYTSDAPGVPIGFEAGARLGEIALGHEHACVIKESDSSVYCWGRNVEGQIGNGTTAVECETTAGKFPGPDGNQLTPFKVPLCAQQ